MLEIDYVSSLKKETEAWGWYSKGLVLNEHSLVLSGNI